MVKYVMNSCGAQVIKYSRFNDIHDFKILLFLHDYNLYLKCSITILATKMLTIQLSSLFSKLHEKSLPISVNVKCTENDILIAYGGCGNICIIIDYD